ncbi:MAG: hypothetical protein HY296_06190 [Thaumarchaeota archaeon]|nr:hypothetical protein [Nitrososphaerota archaeon]
MFAIMPGDEVDFGKRVYLWLVNPPSASIYVGKQIIHSCYQVFPKTGPNTDVDMVKYAWSLIHTFVPKELGPNVTTISCDDAVRLIEDALSGRDTKLLMSLDASVAKAQSRIAAMRSRS